MKKIVMLLLVASFAVMAFADSVSYYSSNTCTINLGPTARDIKTQGKIYRSGTYFQIIGAVAEASANSLYLVVGSGSTVTGSYVPKLDIAIPMKPDSFDSNGNTRNFVLDLDTVWFEQQLATTNVDYRGATLNVTFRSAPKGSPTIGASLGAFYLNVKNVAFSR